MILAVDPGETSGWAVLDGFGNTLGFGQGNERALHTFLSSFEDTYGAEPSTVIIESYKVLPTAKSLKANVGSKLITSQVIGMVRGFCLGWNCTVIMQNPQDKNIGYKWMGLKPPSNHAESHQTDALAHGYYYLVKTGAVKVQIAP